MGEQGFQAIWPSDLVLTPHDPYSNLTKTLSRQIFWYTFMKTEAKLWPPEGEQGSEQIGPSDPSF